MRQFKSSIDPNAFKDHLSSFKWTVDGTSILMANGQSAGIPKHFDEVFHSAIQEIELFTNMKARHIMLNDIPPGIHSPVHVDPVIDNPTRFHLPLITDIRHCYFWDEIRGFQFMPTEFWYEIDYSVKHAVGNFGTNRRVHLIVDLVVRALSLQ